jgi:hypothetical protein
VDNYTGFLYFTQFLFPFRFPWRIYALPCTIYLMHPWCLGHLVRVTRPDEV